MNPVNTARLIIREFNHKDTGFIIKLLNEPIVIENISDKGVRNTQDALNYLNEGPIASYDKFGFGLWMVELKPDNQITNNPLVNHLTPIGMCGLIKRDELEEVDIGYAFLPEYGGKGYAEEAAEATLKKATSEFQLRKVVAITKVGNQPSEKLLIKLGFNFEKILPLFGEENKYFTLHL